MGIFIYLIFLLLFIYGVNLIHKKNVSNLFSIIGLFLMLLQFLSVLGNINIPYTGYPKESYSSGFIYYTGVIFFYVGYFIWSLIALALVYIPIFIKNKKEQNNNSNLQDSNKDDEDLTNLIDKLEKNQKN